MKRVLLRLFMLVLSLACLSSCALEKEELTNRLIIEAIGIDGIPEGVRVTFQVLNTERAGNKETCGSPDEIVKNVSVEGCSVEAALEKLTQTLGKEPMTEHNRVVVFGRKTAQEGLNQYLDMFSRNAADHITVLLAVAENTAEELVSANLGKDVVPAKEIEKVVEASRFNPETVTTPVYRFVGDLQNRTNSPVLPIVGLKDRRDGGKKEVEIRSTAVFDGDRLAGRLEKEYTAGLLWLTDRYSSGIFSVGLPGGENAALTVLSSKTGIKVKVIEGRPHYRIKVKCRANLAELKAKERLPFSPEDIESLRRAAEDQICEKIRRTIDECFSVLHADPFGFGNRLWRSDPELYRRVSGNWNAYLPELRCEVEVRVQIPRIGNEYLRKRARP